MHIHVATRGAPQMPPFETDRRQLPRVKIVLQQDHLPDVILAAHRQPGTMPREPRRVVVAPEGPEPAAHPRNHHLEVSLVTARPLSKQATTASHNPNLLFPGSLTVPPRSAPTNPGDPPPTVLPAL